MSRFYNTKKNRWEFLTSEDFAKAVNKKTKPLVIKGPTVFKGLFQDIEAEEAAKDFDALKTGLGKTPAPKTKPAPGLLKRKIVLEDEEE